MKNSMKQQTAPPTNLLTATMKKKYRPPNLFFVSRALYFMLAAIVNSNRGQRQIEEKETLQLLFSF